MTQKIEAQLAALKPQPQEELALEILLALHLQRQKRPVWPVFASGAIGILLGAAAMFFLMCTLCQPPVKTVVVYQTLPEEPEEPEVSPIVSKVVPPKEMPKPSEPRGAFSVFGINIVPNRDKPFDLDAMLSERQEIARRNTFVAQSIISPYRFERTGYGHSPREYHKILEQEIERM